MAKEIERLELAVDRDLVLAIGTAKELIETGCKTILTKKGIAFTKSEDLGDLTKRSPESYNSCRKESRTKRKAQTT
ncbi:hypothetical protein [Paraburkholderia unamae]|uniref:Uncharacterized protein n=1 Tax=Paraburkholderia unamae TaxID=219649 RepID=A0ABX5KV75_9BURK|nr:hypothetical protein [Paraburkholderia unamae]PVX85876.1 hypothetical protein C7402_103454 [Paraburkholderia unamae]